MRSSLLPALATLLALGCTDPENRQAKERMFSPEEPAREVLRARESLVVAQAAQDPATWRRLWTMDRAEAAARIGAHRSKADVRFSWKLGDREISLREEQHLSIADSGAFHARIENDQDAGMEFVWTGDAAFARSRYGAFRPRRIDRAQQDAWRETASDALRTVFELARGRVSGTAGESKELDGRRVRVFRLAAGDAPRKEASARSPARVFGKVRTADGELIAGPDEDTGRRLEFDERLELESISGELRVDEASAVVLGARLEARLRMSEGPEQPAGDLRLTVDYQLSPEPGLTVAPPEKVLPSDIPHAVNDPLWFLGDKAPSAAPADDEAE